ncbi:MAG: serine/threonine-protein kinase [Fimbriiglobus sp.]
MVSNVQEYLLKYTEESLPGTRARQHLQDWYNAYCYANEPFLAMLIRTKVLVPTAERTLQLAQKGFIKQLDPSLLFTPKTWKLLSKLSGNGLLEIEAAQVETHSVAKSETDHNTRDDVVGPANKPESSKPLPKPMPRTEALTHIPAIHPPRFNSDIPSLPNNAGDTIYSEREVNHPKVGDVLGKCLITGVLGKGGHGVVYTALHQTLNIPVAVKLLFADGMIADDFIRKQLTHEARTLAKLNHPNVTRVLDFDDGAVPYVVLEFVEGPSLAELIAQTGGLRPNRAIELLKHCILGLQAAAEHGIVHRDIKPGNILLTKTGIAKIADLGLALSKSDSVTSVKKSSNPIGTCAYMAPEQAVTAHEVDFRADIYSLGATFYHVMTGRLPFTARSPREFLIKHAHEPVVPPHMIEDSGVDVGTSEVLVRMMAKNPHDRYETYAELLEAIEKLKVGTPRPATQSAEGDTPQKRSGLWGRLFTQQREKDSD